MKRRLLVFAAVALAFSGGIARASLPSSGTLSPATPTLSYNAGPFPVSNPSGAAEDEPICVSGACDTFNLTVDVPAGYAATHPGTSVVVTVNWTDLSGLRPDFDVFIYDTNGHRVTSAATANDPEVALLPAVAAQYVIHVIPFRVSGESISATITLGPPPPTGLGRTGLYLASSDVFSCNTHLTGSSAVFIHDGDSEPAVAMDGNGAAWVTSNPGLGGDQGMWQITDPCGKFFNFIGGVTTGEGGGDTDVEIAPVRNALGFYNIYATSLYLANTTVGASIDGGQHFVVTPVTNTTPVNDREWLAAYDSSTVYLSYRSLNTGNQLFVVRSNGSGLPGTWVGPYPVFQDLIVPSTLSTQLGPIMTDKRPVPSGTLPLHSGPDGQGNVYHPFLLGSSMLYLGISHDFGVTWHSSLAFQSPSFVHMDNIFCWGAVDATGTVYLCFSTGHDIYYCYSTDARFSPSPTWSSPVRVNDGLQTKTSIFPAMAAGSAGRLVFTWYGRSGESIDDPTAQWHVFHARTNNAQDAVPTFEQVRVSDHVVRTGTVCEGGTLGCSGDTRDLLDDFEIAVNPVDGSSFITFTDDASGPATFISRELAGGSVYSDRVVADHSQFCPRALTGCDTLRVGNSCLIPGALVAVDPAGDETSQEAQRDIRSMAISEPLSPPGSLVFTMQVSGLQPASLPPNSFWRMQWIGPDGTTRYVRMLNCATGGLSYDYGHFTSTGSVSDGVPDAGTFGPDGNISITIARSKVGDLATGQRLTSIAGDTRIVVGNCPGSPGAFAPDDAIAGTSYTLAGNAGCAPTATVVRRFTATPTAEGVELEWSVDPALQTDVTGWNVYRGGAADQVTMRVNTDLIPIGMGGDYSWRDRPSGSGPFFYHLAGVHSDGSEAILAGAEIDGAGAAGDIRFGLAGRNPFSGAAAFSYSLPQRERVRINVYSVAGELVRTLAEGEQSAGEHRVEFALRAQGQRPLGPGVYLVRFTAGSFAKNVRVVALQ
jgi:hypothetical protein